MDMLVDKNGSIWVLEYGTQWFARNSDARLSRIDFVRSNRPPLPVLTVDKDAGATPCTVVFDWGKTRDYDGDELTFELDFQDGTPKVVQQHRLVAEAGAGGVTSGTKRRTSVSHTFAQPGLYEVTLRVSDPEGAWRQVKQKIHVGNERPVVAWDLGGKNRSFYQPGSTLNYAVQVTDQEDGSLAQGQINANAVATTIDYLAEGFDMTLIAQGHQAAMQASNFSRGKALIDRSDCKTCHAEDRRVNGPAYQDVAQRYRGNTAALNQLAAKVIKGGSGVWGETVMSAHPQISLDDATEMVRWILSLGDAVGPKSALAPRGQYPLVTPPAKEPGKKAFPGTYILRANYRDRGSSTQGPLDGGEVLALRPAFQQAEMADSLSAGILTYRPTGGDTVVLRDLKDRSFFVFKRTDLTGISGVSLGIGGGDKNNEFGGGRVELRLDGPNGLLVGQAELKAPPKGRQMQFAEVNVPIPSGAADGKFHTLYFIFRNEKAPSQPIVAVDWVRFEM
jgi:cytochrome c